MLDGTGIRDSYAPLKQYKVVSTFTPDAVILQLTPFTVLRYMYDIR